jgi:hypothetical protein
LKNNPAGNELYFQSLKTFKNLNQINRVTTASEDHFAFPASSVAMFRELEMDNFEKSS